MQTGVPESFSILRLGAGNRKAELTVAMIEGIFYFVAVLFIDGVTSYTGDLRTLFEIRNAKDANELFLMAFQEKRSLDTALIKEIQFRLTQNTYDTRRYRLGERPGEYKKHDYVTGKEEVGAAPEDVEDELEELLSELKDIPDEKVLTAAAYFHVKFENIHPFADGNGRTGRLLMNYLLVMHDHPPIVIHEEDRKTYFEALEAWNTNQELAPMVTFLQQQTVKTWQKQINRYVKNQVSIDQYFLSRLTIRMI